MSVVFVSIMNSYNIGMCQASNKAGFLFKALNEVVIGSKPGWKNLDRDFAIEILLVGFIHTSHPALPEWGKDTVITKRSVNEIVLLHHRIRKRNGGETRRLLSTIELFLVNVYYRLPKTRTV
jgi:hypothetical protein